MSRSASRTGDHTIEEWLGAPADRRLELIDGELLEKAAPDEAHSNAQAGLIGELRPKFNRKGGAGGPGGWWIRSEIDIRLGELGVRPDVVGWRRSRVETMPSERPVTVPPDWVCEIVSESNAANDTVLKLHRYHQAGIAHYWLVDPRAQSLTVYRHHPAGYLAVLAATRRETVRAEPFEAIELRVGLLFGDDPDEG